jgi:hypothetical protein
MAQFLRHLSLFLLLSLTLTAGVIGLGSAWVARQDFQNWETESNTLVMGQGEHYDLMISGISHARNLSRHRNHQRLERILGRSIINIGQGLGLCGVAEQAFYLRYFLAQGNTVDTLLYVLSPPLMFSEALAQNPRTFEYEPFAWDFWWGYADFSSENKLQRQFHYLRSKLDPRWLLTRPASRPRNDDRLPRLDSAEMRAGFRLAYGDSLDQRRFARSRERLREQVDFARAQGIEVCFVIPPAVFGRWPGHEQVLAFLQAMQQRHGTPYLDCAEALREPRYYYDHHHLNTEGVQWFARHCLLDLWEED